MNYMEVGGIEPHTRVAAHGLTPYCDHIVTVLLRSISTVISSSFRYDCYRGAEQPVNHKQS